ncbi:MAG: sigma-70 family RNA polymerase sigma factor [Cellulomonas sp.]|uniref:sigma-70 family RNA polymerase sigma factor n=1 Tax=Cellulomonas sp. TaxID=40001 RepID=UPI00181A2274|nr:sigma-70 family RNA polymerase sigma factor [Cellulomonas sp.]NMM16135.1 sigma-70 family RNA polymerase sigma factor [Cellulomonas sp.]NMM32294.1 sigma-70 family RNA polymerase sigma factor [Cellulomonas sp.]
MSDWEHVLDTLVRERGPALVRYAALLTGDLGDADDLVQEALIRSFSQGRPLRETLAAESYVRRAILSIFLDGYRRRRRWAAVRHLLARPDDAEGLEAAASSRIDVQSALLTLRPRLRACVVLRFYDDLTVPEIARQLALSDGTVKRYLSDPIGALEGVIGPLHQDRTEDVTLIHTGSLR